jgi:hypothetical protein
LPEDKELASPPSSASLPSWTSGFSDDLKKLDDENVYRKLQGHWIIEMSEMLATANAKSIEEIKSFLSRQKETYKTPYDKHPKDRLRQCVFGGTSNALDFLPLTEQETDDLFLFWFRWSLPRCIFLKKNSIQEPICSKCGQKLWRFSRVGISK